MSPASSSVPVKPDGSFTVTGLRKGITHFGFASPSGAAQHLGLVRIERDGIAQVDSRRRFVAEGLAAGTYEVNVAVYDPSRHETSKVFKQQVTVADNAVSEVTVVVKAKP